MDQTEPTPQIPIQPTEKSHGVLTLVISILATVLVVGIGCYLVLTRVLMYQPSTIGGCHDKLILAEMEIEGLEQQLTEMETDSIEPTTQTESEIDEYEGWSTFTDSQYGLGWRYPTNWAVREEVIAADQSVVGKNGFCLYFSTTPFGDETTGANLTICYREQSDSSSTTWFRTGVGYSELGKVATSIDMGGQKITEKTLFGENGEVADIIYAQNVADDETGFSARVAIGEYYFSMMANPYGFFESGQGLSTADQNTIEKIMGSLTL